MSLRGRPSPGEKIGREGGTSFCFICKGGWQTTHAPPEKDELRVGKKSKKKKTPWSLQDTPSRNGVVPPEATKREKDSRKESGTRKKGLFNRLKKV